jgi:hypothetical protein
MRTEAAKNTSDLSAQVINGGYSTLTMFGTLQRCH